MRNSNRFLLAAAACLLLCALPVLVWYENWGPGYYSELNTIRSKLSAIPNVEILELAGHDDTDIPLLRHLDHIHARIKVADKGELVFAELSRDSVSSTQHLYLVSVGPYLIRVRGEGFVGVYKAGTGIPMRSEFGSGSIDIGPQGEFAGLLPVEISSIRDAVAHYEDILRVVESWPETPEKPQHLKTEQGTDFYYWVTTRGAEELDPLWKAPLSSLKQN